MVWGGGLGSKYNSSRKVDQVDPGGKTGSQLLRRENQKEENVHLHDSRCIPSFSMGLGHVSNLGYI